MRNISHKTSPKSLSRLPFYGSIIFFLLLFAFEEYYFNFPHLRFMTTLRAGVNPNGIGSTAFAITIALGTFLAIWISSQSNVYWRIVYFLLFTIGTIIQYGYWITLGRTLAALDVYTALSSSAELWVDATKMYANTLSLIPIGGFALLLLLTRRNEPYGLKAFLFISLGILSIFSLTAYTGYQVPKGAVPSVFNVLVDTAWTDVQTNNIERLSVPFRASSPPTNNIILIIDESVRGDSLSLNGYPRPTTPYLEALEAAGTLHNWGIAVSAATCSLASNAAIVNGLPALPDTDELVFQNPTIFHYAEAMGYKTWYLDAQSSSIWNGLQDQDVLLIDERITPLSLGHDEEVDFAAAKVMRQTVKDSTGNFILINKLGVHFPYYKMYPEEAAVWTPTVVSERYEGGPELINTYDNALLFNVDTFFKTLLEENTALENTTIVYTSDHGQTLGQVEGWWAHCGSSRIEAVVPLFLIGDLPPMDTTYPASHFNIFPTVLDLMGYPVDQRLLEYPPSLLTATAADQKDRYFLSTPEEFAHGEVVNFDAAPPPLLSEDSSIASP
ncbi:MAG: sulfatase-like hydrolase/transferase [Ardenticatenaceae bacterium]|nr:sulfatase-like hydrolase/transferase [Ardenticatenaceae bacterium]